MAEKRLKPTKTISTKTVSCLSEKVCAKIREASYANIAGAMNLDGASAQRILANSYYILHVQQEFDDYCKIISGEYSAETELCDICEELRSFCAVVTDIIEKKDMVFGGVLPNRPVYARVDRRGIRQALAAVVLNAVEHAKQGGKIEVKLEEAARTVKISVHDNGSGMDEETLNRCMEPLFSGKMASNNKSPLGLGLTLARYYVQKCGGRIKIKSFYKKATRAEIILPRPKDFSAEELHSAPKPISGYADTEITVAMAPIL